MKVKRIIQRLWEREKEQERAKTFFPRILWLFLRQIPTNRVVYRIFFNESENRGYLENKRLMYSGESLISAVFILTVPIYREENFYIIYFWNC